jgi:hypothetical protein
MKPSPIRISPFAFTLLALAASTARAQDPPPPPEANPAPFAPVPARGGGFGAAGEWVLTMQTAFGGTSGGFLFLHKASGGGSEIAVHPAVDYFLNSTVSVGGVVGVDSVSGGSTNLGLGARAGFNLSINEHVGFWPTAGVFASHTSDSSNHTSSSSAGLEVFAPFLYHLAPHFFVGLGPSFDISFNNNQQKDFGIDFVIGGWI